MEKQIQIAAKLYECREAARLLLGDSYSVRMAEYGQIVNCVAEGKSLGILEAATEIAKDPALNGYEKIQVLASAVELIEPGA